MIDGFAAKGGAINWPMFALAAIVRANEEPERAAAQNKSNS